MKIVQKIISLLTKGYNLLNGFLVDTFAQGKYPDYWNAYLENRGWMLLLKKVTKNY